MKTKNIEPGMLGLILFHAAVGIYSLYEYMKIRKKKEEEYSNTTKNIMLFFGIFFILAAISLYVAMKYDR